MCVCVWELRGERRPLLPALVNLVFAIVVWKSCLWEICCCSKIKKSFSLSCIQVYCSYCSTEAVLTSMQYLSYVFKNISLHKQWFLLHKINQMSISSFMKRLFGNSWKFFSVYRFLFGFSLKAQRFEEQIWNPHFASDFLYFLHRWFLVFLVRLIWPPFFVIL